MSIQDLVPEGRGIQRLSAWGSRASNALAGLGVLGLVAVVAQATVSRVSDGLGNPWPDVSASWAGLGLISVLTTVLLVASEVLHRGGASLEFSRKFAHVGGALVATALPWAFDSHWPVLVLALAFAAVFLVSRRLHVLVFLYESERNSLGDLVFPMGVYAAFFLSRGDPLVFLIAVLIVGLSDTSAALAGRRYGRHGFRLLGSQRSFEGSLAFFVTALGVTVSVLLAGSDAASAYALAVGVLCAAVGAGVEAISPKGLDNVLVPAAIVVTLTSWVGLG